MLQQPEALAALKAGELYSHVGELDSAPYQYEELAAESVVVDQAGRITLRESSGIDFAAPRHRAAITLAMIRDFGSWARPDAALEQILDGRMGYRANFPILPISFLEGLTRDQEDILLVEKERAILQYVQLETFPASPEFNVIVDGIHAYYELFVHNLDLVHLLAWSSCRNVPYADLYQEGAMQLLDAALHTGPDCNRRASFRAIAYNNIRKQKGRGIVPLYYDSVLPPGTFPYSQVQSLHDFNRKIADITSQKGYLPPVSVLSAELKLGRDTILGFMSVCRDMVHIDDLDKGGEVELDDLSLIGDDFAEGLLTRLNDRSMIEAIFKQAPLSESQKIVLSLHYGVFCAELADHEVLDYDKTVFTYPKLQKDFEALVDAYPDLSSIGVAIFKAHHEFARKLHDTALVAVRQFILEHAEFDIANRIDGRQAERQMLIDTALIISPDKRLGARDIRRHFGEGDLPGGEDRIRKLFGSVPAFQEACGFTPDRGQSNALLTDEEIIALAQKLQPDKPLRSRQIRQYSKLKEFVSLQAILGRWESLPAFHRACGFEV